MLDAATDAIEAADVVLVVGTSSVVYPVAALPHLARRRDARIVEINIDETPLTAHAHAASARRGRRCLAGAGARRCEGAGAAGSSAREAARAGVGSLGDNELVALLLGTGVRARSALTVAQDVLERAGGVRGLRADWRRRTAARVGRRRAARGATAGGGRARTPCRSAAMLGERPRLAIAPGARRVSDADLCCGHREERVGVVMLDAKHRVIRTEVLSVGTLDSSIAHPREVFRAATLASASAIAIFHNHPSGDPRPEPG